MKQAATTNQPHPGCEVPPCVRRPKGTRLFFAIEDTHPDLGIGPGDALFVRPRRRARVGDLVIVQRVKKGYHSCGIYGGQADGKVTLFKNGKSVTWPAADCKLIGVVIGADAFYGLDYIELGGEGGGQ
jgi:hypothetical protein